MEPVLLDLSHWNIEIVSVEAMRKKNVVGVYLKCTQGNYLVDKCFHRFWDTLRKAYIPLSAYLFFDPFVPPKEQFDLFRKTFGGRVPDMPVALDCEWEKPSPIGQTTRYIKDLILRLSEWQALYFPHLPPPLIYTRATWWNYRVEAWSGWKNFGLWAARYGVSQPWAYSWSRYKVRDWDKWVLHQFSADKNGLGKEYGVMSLSVDLNRPTQEFLERYIKPAEMLPEDPKPQPTQGKVLVEVLNVRSGPGTAYGIVGSLRKNTVVPILSEIYDKEGNKWVQISRNPDKYCAKVYRNQTYILTLTGG